MFQNHKLRYNIKWYRTVSTVPFLQKPLDTQIFSFASIFQYNAGMIILYAKDMV
jgi:hypothetical protein